MPLVFFTLSSRFRGSQASTLDRYFPSRPPPDPLTWLRGQRHAARDPCARDGDSASKQQCAARARFRPLLSATPRVVPDRSPPP
eukprot:2617762-Pyramimonas_sp.AAC.1